MADELYDWCHRRAGANAVSSHYLTIDIGRAYAELLEPGHPPEILINRAALAAESESYLYGEARAWNRAVGDRLAGLRAQYLEWDRADYPFEPDEFRAVHNTARRVSSTQMTVDIHRAVVVPPNRLAEHRRRLGFWETLQQLKVVPMEYITVGPHPERERYVELARRANIEDPDGWAAHQRVLDEWREQKPWPFFDRENLKRLKRSAPAPFEMFLSHLESTDPERRIAIEAAIAEGPPRGERVA